MKKENKIQRKAGSGISVNAEAQHSVTTFIISDKTAKQKFPTNLSLIGIAGKAAKFGGWSVDLISDIVYWSDEVCDIHEMPRGYTPVISEGFNFFAPEYRDAITKIFTDCAKSGIPFALEVQIITSKGRRVWVRTIGEALKDKKGNIIKVQGAFKDISEKKQYELALLESEEKYRALVEASQDAIFIDQDKKIVYINPAGVKIFGAKSKEELQGRNPFDFFPPENHQMIFKRMEIIASSGNSLPANEDRIIRLDGKEVDVEVTAAPLMYKGRSAFQVVFKDISKRKAAERKLKNSEESFRKAFASHPGIVGITTLSEGKYIDVNDNFCKLLGYTRSEVIGTSSKELGIFFDNKKRDDLLYLLKKDGRAVNFEVQIKTKTGKVRDGLFSSELIEIDGQKCLLGQFNDITELKESIEELRQSEERFSKVFLSSPLAISISELDSGRLIEVNDKYLGLTGYNRDEVIGRTSFDLNLFIREESRDEVASALQKHGILRSVETDFRTKSGSISTWKSTLEIIEIDGKKCILSLIEDITESKRLSAVIESKLHLTQFALTHSLDELLEETMNETEKLTGSLIGFYHFVDDNQQNLVLQNWSPRTKEMFCKAEGKGSHYPINEAGVWVDCTKTRKPVIHNDYKSLPHRKGLPKDHAEVIREIVVPVLRNNKIKAILGVGNKPYDYNEKDVETVSLLAEMAWDITEFKMKDEELKESEAKLKEMVATKDKFFNIIAHDLRSPFNAIMGFSELLEDQMKEKDYGGIEEYSKFINTASRRAMNLLSNLLDWSRSQTGKIKFDPEYFDLAFIINEIVDLYTDIAVQKSIVIQKVMQPNILVIADKPMIDIILRNLISNAIKFSNINGSIVIKAEENELGVSVSVKDNGVGISPEDINNLFRLDVNHTTPGTQKEKGTGLGLLLCKEFVEKHNGELHVESDVSTGSTFTFDIPKRPDIEVKD